MGESNAVKVGRPRFQRRTWEATKDAYKRALTEDERQSAALPATYEVSIIGRRLSYRSSTLVFLLT